MSDIAKEDFKKLKLYFFYDAAACPWSIIGIIFQEILNKNHIILFFHIQIINKIWIILILFPERKMYRAFLTLILIMNTVHSEFGAISHWTLQSSRQASPFRQRATKHTSSNLEPRPFLSMKTMDSCLSIGGMWLAQASSRFLSLHRGISFWPDQSMDFPSSKPPT